MTIRPGAAAKHVIAVQPLQRVGEGAADQAVAAQAADGVLDAGIGVALGLAAAADAAGQVHGHRPRRAGIGDGVAAGAAEIPVAAGAAAEHVVAGAADEAVVAAAAGERVVAVAAEQDVAIAGAGDR